VKLVGGAHSMEGRLEIKYKNTWFTVCDNYITDDDASAICNMLTLFPLSRFMSYFTVLRSRYSIQ